MTDRPTFPPYIPDAEAEWDAPLTPEEMDLAVMIFRVIRVQAAGCQHGPATRPYSAYGFSVWFDEAQPPDARVQVTYDCREFSSGYREDGVGPDLGTALSRMSDHQDRNGTRNLIRR